MTRSSFRQLMLLLLVAACSNVETTDVYDIDSVARLHATEQRRIGSVDDPEIGFSRLVRVDIDRDGMVYALEYIGKEIRVYDAAGHVVRRIGGNGAGPGEFEDSPLFGIHGDTLWTYQSNGRITLFDRSGAVIGSGRTQGLRVPTHNGWGWVMPQRMSDNGLLVGWFSRISYSRGDTTGVDEGDPIPVPRVLFDGNGTIVDTLSIMTAPPPRMVRPPGYDEPEPKWVTHGGSQHMVPEPPSELPQWLPADDGHFVLDIPYTTTPGTFTVTRYGVHGDTVWHRTLAYTPEPWTEEQLTARAAQPSIYRSGAPPPVLEEALVNVLRAEMDFPEFRPPVDYAWLANDGAVWLPRAASGGARRWIVLQPNGDMKGEVQLQENVRPMWSRGDTLWASVPDEMDVPWLVRYVISE